MTESTIDDILRDVPRFRILCVGRSGVGKSSLINRVFGITEAKVSTYTPGEADIDKEFVSDQNQYFVLHDSKGFEPGDNINFDLVARFLKERRRKEFLKDRLHAIWLCTETPRAGGRVFEEGDKKFLVLAHQLEVPVVIVFTKYDKLVRSKEIQAGNENQGMDKDTLRKTSAENASDAFHTCKHSVEKTMNLLKIPTPPCINISIRKPEDYGETIEVLVRTTRQIVQERLEGDAWVTWAIAQRASLPEKINTCIDKGVSFYYHTLSGSIPGVGRMLLWQCLAKVHHDIVTCWNFKDEHKILGSTEFQQLILHLVQDLDVPSQATPAPSLDGIGHLVNLITATGSIVPIAPPVAILGLTYFFVKWFSDAIIDHVPDVERLLMAYTIDLISVLRSLFDFTLKPDLVGTTNWKILIEAFEAFQYSERRKAIHDSCVEAYNGRPQILTREAFRQTVKNLLDE